MQNKPDIPLSTQIMDLNNELNEKFNTNGIDYVDALIVYVTETMHVNPKVIARALKIEDKSISLRDYLTGNYGKEYANYIESLI